jgi:hypothetical protein
LYGQVEDAIEYASAGGTPYLPEQILAIAYKLVAQTKAMPEACKEWRRQVATTKIWAQFQSDFAIAYKEMCDDRQEAEIAGYGGANAAMIQGTEEALANLAAATISDCMAVDTLTATNAKLTSDLIDAKVRIDE